MAFWLSSAGNLLVCLACHLNSDQCAMERSFLRDEHALLCLLLRKPREFLLGALFGSLGTREIDRRGQLTGIREHDQAGAIHVGKPT